MDKTDRILKSLISRPEIKTPIASDMFLPNNSDLKSKSDRFSYKRIMYINDEGKLNDAPELVWDDVNHRFGIGTATPISLTEIQGGLTTTGAVLTLSSKETSTVTNDILGIINFRAALDATGGDANLVGASISAIAENNFSSANETGLQFSTGVFDHLPATERMRINNQGNVGVGAAPSVDGLTSSTFKIIQVTAALQGVLSVASTRADSDAAGIGTFDFSYQTNSANHKRIVSFGATTDGTTANQRGGAFTINTKQNGVAGLVERFKLNNVGNVGINCTPNANAILDVTSTTKAFMPPRMTTTQRDAIASPTAGMVIYNSTTNVLNFHNGTIWGAV